MSKDNCNNVRVTLYIKKEHEHFIENFIESLSSINGVSKPSRSMVIRAFFDYLCDIEDPCTAGLVKELVKRKKIVEGEL